MLLLYFLLLQFFFHRRGRRKTNKNVEKSCHTHTRFFVHKRRNTEYRLGLVKEITMNEKWSKNYLLRFLTFSVDTNETSQTLFENELSLVKFANVRQLLFVCASPPPYLALVSLHDSYREGDISAFPCMCLSRVSSCSVLEGRSEYVQPGLAPLLTLSAAVYCGNIVLPHNRRLLLSSL